VHFAFIYFQVDAFENLVVFDADAQIEKFPFGAQGGDVDATVQAGWKGNQEVTLTARWTGNRRLERVCQARTGEGE